MPWRKIAAISMVFSAVVMVTLSAVHDTLPRQVGLVDCEHWQERPVVGSLGNIALQIERASDGRVDPDRLVKKIADRNSLSPGARQVYSGQPLLVPDVCNQKKYIARYYTNLARPMVELVKLLD